MKDKFYSVSDEQIARISKALSHPARVFIMNFLANCSACYTGNIVDELPIAQSSVSQHLKELQNAGLIQGTVETPRVYYCINKENWKVAKDLFGKFFNQELQK